MFESEEAQGLQEQLNIRRNNLRRLELRLANYTPMEAPISLLNQIEDEKSAIAQLEQQLAQYLGAPPGSAQTRSPNLPTRFYRSLIGRSSEIDRIMAILRDPKGQPIVSITGLGGIGKTALAREVAERCDREEIYESMTWDSAKQQLFLGGRIVTQSTPIATFKDLMNSMGWQLGLWKPGSQVPFEEQEAILRNHLKSHRCLIFVDNLETVEDLELLTYRLVDMLQPSRALLTSRPQLTDLDYVHTVRLSGLAAHDAIEFLLQEGRDRGAPAILNATRASLKRIHKVTGGAPLAMKLIVGQILGGMTIEVALDRLAKAEDEEQLYRFIYFDLWGFLTLPAQKVLVALSSFASSVTQEMVLPVSKVRHKGEFYHAISELVRFSLVDMSERGEMTKRRYSIHQLTRHFINSDLREMWSQEKSSTEVGEKS